MPPLVSIVTATYNRSNVLRLAIESVLAQTLEDWELWVIGDACTDDSEDVVLGFGDPRIRWYNRDENFGEQSGPNNDGVARAGGRYLAYLNHDDLWLGDHLERAVDEIERTGADLVFSLTDHVGPDGPSFLWGSTPTGRFEPYIFAPASAWLLRRKLVEEIGPWRPARALHTTPSQDWLYRAWRAGRDMRLHAHLGVVAFPSGIRHHAYARREAEPQTTYWRRIREEPDFRERELLALGAYHAAWQVTPKPLRRHVLWAGYDLVQRASLALRANPTSAYHLLRYRRKGGAMDKLHRNRGLPPLTRRGPSKH